jgi:branched-chain amino acid transport system substrate-binding protein
VQGEGVHTPLFVSSDGGAVQSLSNSVTRVWDIVPSYTDLSEFDANIIMKTLGIKDFAVAWEDDSLAQGADTALTSYVPANGGQLLANVAVSDSTTDFVPLATQLQASGAKAVLVWGIDADVAGLQKAASTIGYSPTWVTPFFSLQSGYLSLAGTLANGTYLDSILPSTGTLTPQMRLYRTYIHKVNPLALDGGEQGWQQAAVMVDALKAATKGGKFPTPAAINAAMKKIDGVVSLAHENFTQRQWGGDTAAIFKVENGAFVQVQPFTTLP